VVPRRYIGQGPFTYEVSGQPILNRDGKPRAADHLPPDLLPVCDENTSPNNCNGALNRIYEVRGKPVVRAVVDRGEPLRTVTDVTNFARWWVKTILLLQHPACRNAFPGVKRRAWQLRASVYKDLIKGVLQPDTSLWVAVSDDANGSHQLPELLRLYLPTTSTPEGGGGQPATLLAGFPQAHSRILQIQVVVHPLCDFEHPFESAGLAVRLWPQPPNAFDVINMPALSAEGRQQLGALMVDAKVGAHLPASGWRQELQTVPDGHSLVQPVFVRPTST